MVKSLPILALLFVFVIRSPADDTNAAPASSSTNSAASNAAPVSSGAAPKVLAPTNDVGIGSDGAPKDQDSYQARIGELYAPGGEAYILPIRIPSLPEEQQFVSVHLRTQLMGISNEANGLGN